MVSSRQESNSTDEPEFPEENESLGLSPSKKLSLPSKSTEPSLNYQGPTKERRCTDLLCFTIFVLVIVSWLSIGVYGKSAQTVQLAENLSFSKNSFLANG